MIPPNRPGTIVTFYSYKGGTGRTMSLANLAWVLASNDKKVLIIDWDLEAPGLHRYLRPFLVDPELQDSPGLIDFVWDLAAEKVTPTERTLSRGEDNLLSLEDYVVGLDWDFNGKGSISLVPAGRQGEDYPRRVNTFDWNNFYERLGGGKLLYAAGNALRQEYDYVLIDSRTGVSDTSGICTVQMPDLLVVCFTLNHQSVRGAAAIAASVIGQRGSDFPIFPVPTRLENAETDKLNSAMAFAKRMFAPFLSHIQKGTEKLNLREQEAYWADVGIPYRTFYAFEEVPAPFKDEPGKHDTILAATERLSRWITDGEVSELRPFDEAQRQSVLSGYAFTTLELPEPGTARDAFITGTPDATEIARLLSLGLQHIGLRIEIVQFEELGEVRGGWPASVEKSRNGIFIFGNDRAAALEAYLRRFLQQALEAEGDRVAIPVVTSRNALPTLPAMLRGWQVSILDRDAIPDAVERIRNILMPGSSDILEQRHERPTAGVKLPPSFNVAVESLASEDPIARQAGARALSRMGTREADQELIEHAGDEDETIRGLAIEASRRSDIDTERFLTELLDGDITKRITAAVLLGGRGEARAFPGLVRLLNDTSSSKARIAGASALGHLGDPLAQDWLLPRLSDRDREVRRAVARSLIQIAVDNDTLVHLWEVGDYQLLELFDDYYVKTEKTLFLLDRIRERSNESRAVRLLTKIAEQSPSVCSQLSSLLLEHSDPRTRPYVAQALGSISGPEVTAALVTGLNDVDPEVRVAVARAFGSLIRPEALAPLVNAFYHGDPQVRAALAGPLASAGQPEATAALVDGLSDSHSEVRAAVALALGSVSGPEATDALLRGLDDRDMQVRAAAVGALGSVGGPDATAALAKVLNDHDPEMRAAAARALGSVGRPEATEALVKSLNDVEPQVRAALAGALARSPGTQVTAALNELLGDSVREVRIAALKSRAGTFDYIKQQLLTEYINGSDPWLDPLRAIDQSHIKRAAEQSGMPESEIMANYEEINRLLNNQLILNWSRKEAEPMPTGSGH
jgi:HEAT repeat protein/MinD-like ATPase involved in chromosome partitioning or flagellar assembly